MKKNIFYALFILIIVLIFITSCKPRIYCIKHGHIVKIDKEIEPTCLQTGLSRGSHCSVCKQVLIKQEVLEKTDHKLIDLYLSEIPKKDKDGILFQKCKFCDKKVETVLKYTKVKYNIMSKFDVIEIPELITNYYDLPQKIDNVNIKWYGTDSYTFMDDGKTFYKTAYNQKKLLEAVFECYGVSISKQYEINLAGYSPLEKIDIASKELNIPDITDSDLQFKTTLKYNVTAKYISSNPKIISNDGKVIPQREDSVVTITIIFSLGDVMIQKDYDILVKKYNPDYKKHQLLVYSSELKMSEDCNLDIKEGKLQLKNNAIEDTYYSKEYTTIGFKSLIGSWAAITSENSTCELRISLKINNVWSEFITYGKWGLGLENASYDQENDLIKLSTDEVVVKNYRIATGIKYAITLSRTDTSCESPKLSLVSFALDIDNYSFYIDKNKLSTYVEYDVPQLNQNIVPIIGNSICSATSTTMLLKYKGLNFNKEDSEYEHRYIAKIVRDYGNKIYGNWVYNTVAMGAYGFNSYVARMYSLEELMYHLENVGPVALSVKGTMTSDIASYTTGGHLIVCIGYSITDEAISFICNDPNVKEVKCTYTYDVLKSTWRNIAYIIQ